MHSKDPLAPMPQNRQAKEDLLQWRPEGLYCPLGGFYIDPWKPVERALITHAHADHAKAGHQAYLATPDTVALMQARLGLQETACERIAYGASKRIGAVRVSFHPAGHIPGSAQILVEHRGNRWVCSGDYKTDNDGWCQPFEPVPCRVFITESTFGLPIYRWPNASSVFSDMLAWWADNRAHGRCSVLVGYSLGKAQRLLKGLQAAAPEGLPGPLFAHGAILRMNEVLEHLGYGLPAVERVERAAQKGQKKRYADALVLAVPSAQGSPSGEAWLRRFEPYSLAFASGWMAIRGPRRRRAADRGFVLSDHADWDGLNAAVEATGAERMLATHGYAEPFSRWWRERGLEADVLETAFIGERGEIGEAGSGGSAADVELEGDVEPDGAGDPDTHPSAGQQEDQH
jgi:putative mRNA 3-end processing factor